MRKKVLTKQLALSVSEETWQRILESTNKEEISFSSWIRDAIERKVANNCGNKIPKSSIKEGAL